MTRNIILRNSRLEFLPLFKGGLRRIINGRAQRTIRIISPLPLFRKEGFKKSKMTAEIFSLLRNKKCPAVSGGAFDFLLGP